MKTNKAMRNLLNELAKSKESISSNLFNPTFHEWDNCILVDASSLRETDSIEETIYQDRTDLEASINHYHIEDLRTGIKLISNWKENIKLNYPEKDFILILSSTIEGEDVVIRFYQFRDHEPEWIKLNDLEGYKEEAILVIEILNAVQ
ncbi:MAG TPA: hypothetical protein DEF35_22670 [Paenibacillus sp.]|jgi:hypothetical protein|uniref:hypothetical protein n=1 Tax=Paenibacillus TaxID=44249 RepID=UPI000BA07793|nr:MULTISPECIES: hypothetical protein [Paenibacillus]OZQ68173.1 hypothetical protein CA599_16290 [Paenibacillus taichungensis]HBU84421.1 hypothetical protein [Paenibacillus sp.]